MFNRKLNNDMRGEIGLDPIPETADERTSRERDELIERGDKLLASCDAQGRTLADVAAGDAADDPSDFDPSDFDPSVNSEMAGMAGVDLSCSQLKTPLADAHTDLADAKGEVAALGGDEADVIQRLADAIRREVALRAGSGGQAFVSDEEVDDLARALVDDILAGQKKTAINNVAPTIAASGGDFDAEIHAEMAGMLSD